MLGLDLERFAELSQNMTNAQLAREYSMPVLDIVDCKAELREKGLDIGYGGFPASETPDYAHSNQVIRARADSFIVLGDAEIPDHDAEMLEVAADVGEKFGIEVVALNADMIAVDSLSTWRRAFANPLQFKDELNPLITVIQNFCKRFKTVFENSGNHERRLAHWTEGHLSIGQLLGLQSDKMPNLVFTEYAYLHLESCGPCGKGPRQEWLVCHQDNYSKVPLSVPRFVVQSYYCNIICAHNHRLAIGRDPGNRYWLIEGGHCRDADRTLYKVSRVNTHPKWQPGFVMVLEGVPYLINKDNYRQFMRGNIGRVQT